MIWSAGKSPWKGRRKQNPDHRRAKGRGEPCAEGGHFFHCDSKGWRAGQRPKQVTLCTSGLESEELLSQLCTWVSSVTWVWLPRRRGNCKRSAKELLGPWKTQFRPCTMPLKARLWEFSPTEFSPISVGSRGTRTKGSLWQKVEGWWRNPVQDTEKTGEVTGEKVTVDRLDWARGAGVWDQSYHLA